MFPIAANRSDEESALYVDDVFSTYLYTGNGSTQTINNGIALKSYSFTSGSTFYINDTSSNTYISGISDMAIDNAGNKYLLISFNQIVVKLNSSGTIVWKNKYTNANISALCYDSVNDCIYLGGVDNTTNSSTLTKVSNSGAVVYTVVTPGVGLSNNSYPSLASSRVRRLICDSSGNVFCTSLHSQYDGANWQYFLILLKFNTSGTLLWSKVVYMVTADSSPVNTTDLKTDGTNVFVGFDGGGSNSLGICIFKFNTSGTLLWSNRLTDSSEGYVRTQQSKFFTITPDGAVFGTTVGTTSGTTKIWKLNSDGTFAWAKTIASYNYDRYASLITSDTAGNLYLTGQYSSTNVDPMYIMKFDSAGTILNRMKAFDVDRKSARFIYFGQYSNGGLLVNGGDLYLFGCVSTVSNYNGSGNPDGFPMFVSINTTMSNISLTDIITVEPDTTSSYTMSPVTTFVQQSITPTTNYNISFSSTTAISFSVDSSYLNRTYGGTVNSTGGMVWLKGRTSAVDHANICTEFPAYNVIYPSSTQQMVNFGSGNGASFNSNGFTLGSSGYYNENNINYASWTFRKAAKFFDVVTYTGDGSTSRNISHSLGIAPGMIIVKRTNTTGQWRTWHRAFAVDEVVFLNATTAKSTQLGSFPVLPTSSAFTIGNDSDVNAAGSTYVAYLFAHDTSSTGIIQCGSYTGGGSPTIVTLGWEPQWLMIKKASGIDQWLMLDTMRGIPTGGLDPTFYADAASAENPTGANYLDISATGFYTSSGNGVVNGAGATYIYMAIRRPNKPPTSGTQVYNAIARNGAQFVETTITSVGFPTDTSIVKDRDLGGVNVEWCWQDRLRAIPYWLQSSATDAEIYDAQNITQYGMNGVTFGTNLRVNGGTVRTYVNYFLKRAPGFFDVVCYTGVGAADVKSHNLGVVPELMIVKNRSNAYGWYVFATAANKTLILNTTSADQGPTSGLLQSYTSTTFKWVDTSLVVNGGTMTYVAYLFATLAGISKVGSYTGNGGTQNIECGFATGARFVLIKRTDTTGDWYTWDTARGIVTGNDPHLSLNTTAAEVTTDDSIDPYSPGFTVNQVAATNINVTSATYIFLAIS